MRTSALRDAGNVSGAAVHSCSAHAEVLLSSTGARRPMRYFSNGDESRKSEHDSRRGMTSSSWDMRSGRMTPTHAAVKCQTENLWADFFLGGVTFFTFRTSRYSLSQYGRMEPAPTQCRWPMGRTLRPKHNIHRSLLDSGSYRRRRTPS